MINDEKKKDTYEQVQDLINRQLENIEKKEEHKTDLDENNSHQKKEQNGLNILLNELKKRFSFFFHKE